jgi:hypothetical protein
MSSLTPQGLAQALNRLHRLFLDLLPGGAPVKKSTSQYQALATVRPRDTAGKTCRRMAAEELEDLHRPDAKLQAVKAELKAAVQAMGSRLMDIHGIARQLRSPGERANAQLKRGASCGNSAGRAVSEPDRPPKL